MNEKEGKENSRLRVLSSNSRVDSIPYTSYIQLPQASLPSSSAWIRRTLSSHVRRTCKSKFIELSATLFALALSNCPSRSSDLSLKRWLNFLKRRKRRTGDTTSLSAVRSFLSLLILSNQSPSQFHRSTESKTASRLGLNFTFCLINGWSHSAVHGLSWLRVKVADERLRDSTEPKISTKA